MTENRWTIELFIDEGVGEDTKTVTRAELRTGTGGRLTGRGVAFRNPHDKDVPQIGDELSVSRALHDLAAQLLRAGADDVEQSTHRPAHLTA